MRYCFPQTNAEQFAHLSHLGDHCNSLLDIKPGSGELARWECITSSLSQHRRVTRLPTDLYSGAPVCPRPGAQRRPEPLAALSAERGRATLPSLWKLTESAGSALAVDRLKWSADGRGGDQRRKERGRGVRVILCGRTQLRQNGGKQSCEQAQHRSSLLIKSFPVRWREKSARPCATGLLPSLLPYPCGDACWPTSLRHSDTI